MNNNFEKIIEDKIALLNKLGTVGYFEAVEKAANIISDSISKNGKILLAGNGGSAADAQHFAGELVGRFLKERRAMPAISLCTDPTVITCISNDYGYESVFSRQIEALGSSGDVLIAISTSGNSENLVRAIDIAKSKRLCTIGLLGNNGGKLKELCDLALVVPSDSTPRIQETHTLTVHLLCEIIENKLLEQTNEL